MPERNGVPAVAEARKASRYKMQEQQPKQEEVNRAEVPEQHERPAVAEARKREPI